MENCLRVHLIFLHIYIPGLVVSPGIVRIQKEQDEYKAGKKKKM